MLDKGYLSIGFAEGFSNEDFLSRIKNIEEKEAWDYFEEINKSFWGLPRTRYNLWRFLREFKIGDFVLVPMYKTFSVYKIIGDTIISGQLEEKVVSDTNIIKGNCRELLYNEEPIDLGFLIPVESIEKDISRSKYADAKLTARMKIRQTNSDISDLKCNIEKAIEGFKYNKPISIYEEIIETMKKTLLSEIKTKLDPIKFETLIAWYLNKIGADTVWIPSKNEAIKSDEADGDIVAVFERLQILISVQAKFHTGQTDSWGVNQIEKYTKDLEINMDEENTYINWVITSGDGFTKEAISLAKEKNIRLINGSDFAEMLIKAGLDKIDDAFALN